MNLFDDLPQTLPEEMTDLLVRSKSVRIERIVSTGQKSPDPFWYDQDENEWVAVLCGEAILRFENEPHARLMKAGDHVLIAAHCRHRVEYTSSEEPTVWLAVFFQ
jgi:cupin 2 domain-containing protein